MFHHKQFSQFSRYLLEPVTPGRK